MNVGELKELLDGVSDDMEIMILDGSNGGGVPREINCGPTEQIITVEDGEECCDCEGLVGETVLVMGYGCY